MAAMPLQEAGSKAEGHGQEVGQLERQIHRECEDADFDGYRADYALRCCHGIPRPIARGKGLEKTPKKEASGARIPRKDDRKTTLPYPLASGG